MVRKSWLSAGVLLTTVAGSVAANPPANPHVHFTRSGTQILRDGTPYRAVGADHFMLGYQFHGNCPSTPANLSVDMGAKALADANERGLALFRFSVFGYGAADIQRWR